MDNKTLVIAVDNSTPRPLETAIIAGAAGADFPHANMYAFEKELNAAAEKVLEKVFAPKAGSAGAPVLTMTIEVASDSSSHIGAAICEYAEKVKADALVLMRHNKTTIGRILLGSVTRHCAVHSPVPVIIVPGTV
ncbi:hypothetical protein COCOBI_05-0750 [Coccomyxa sp. Obi]|nr:hypothetical protein COCOBI_05-0750 [Coccomyxa sp. Obi]